jgi:hypothetical protein
MRFFISMIALQMMFAIIPLLPASAVVLADEPARRGGQQPQLESGSLPTPGSQDSVRRPPNWAAIEAGPGSGSAARVDERLFAKQQKEIQERLVAKLASYVPAEFAAYRQAMVGINDADAARAGIGMISKITDLGRTPNQRREVLFACRTAWELCIKQFKASKKEDARALILAEWDLGLKQEEGDVLMQQLDALEIGEFDHSFLTGEFWNLVEHSKKPETMRGVCYILSDYGTRADLNRLQGRLNATPFEDSRRNMIRSAVDYLTWRLSRPEGAPTYDAPMRNFEVSPPVPLRPVPMRWDQKPQPADAGQSGRPGNGQYVRPGGD